MRILDGKADAWDVPDLALLAEAAERLAPEAAAIAAEWARRLVQTTILRRYPESLERVTELNRWFLESHLFQLRERSIRDLLHSNFEGDMALLRAQLDVDPELRSTLSQLYLSLEVSTEIILGRLRRLFAGDDRLPSMLSVYSRLSLELAETLGVAFYEVRTFELRSALRAASSLLESARELNKRAVSPSAVLSNLSDIATRLLRCEKCLVFLWSEADKAYVAATSRGFSEDEFVEIRTLRLRATDFPLVDMLLRGEVSGGSRDDGRVPREMMERFGTHVYGIAPMATTDGQPLGAIAVYRAAAVGFDPTDLRILEGIAQNAALAIENARLVERLEAQADELKRSNNDLEKFAYVASHDLQEPLRTVASFVQLLARRYQGKLDGEADEFIGYTVSGVKRMQALIQDLLTYSRVGRGANEFGPVDTEAALDQALHNLGKAIQESRAVVTHDPLPDVVGDVPQIVQLFQNLVGNGIKFRGEAQPCVHVSAQRNRAGWRFSVTDNGIGIDPRFADRLFVLFQRLHRHEEYPGTGLGLAICKKIVERHGGQIGFRPAPDGGSTFFFTLPSLRRSVRTLAHA